MPLPSRHHGDAAMVRPRSRRSLPALRDHALDVLLDPALASVVALVAWTEHGLVHVADSRGHVVLTEPSRVLAGRDPLADQDPFSDSTTCYPLAAARLRSLFDDPRAPDLAVVHTGGHYWPERGGHLGEHGSLNGVQSRAPLLLSGAGVTAHGVLDAVARTIDVGPTLTALVGGDLSGMEGTPLEHVRPGAAHVVGLLWDGAQCADLLQLAQAGQLPNVARLLERGCAYRGGAIAEFPSVTLVNHTCALTGVGPGRHGIVNNAFYDRDLAEQVVPNASGSWHLAMQWLRPGVRTVWERVPPTTATACVNEPVDRGAQYSTFELVRASGGDAAGAMADQLPPPDQDLHVTRAHLNDHEDYRWSTQIDAVGLQQMLSLWQDGTPPRLTWWNSTLTDTGHHIGGPHSEIARASLRDTDRRLGVWLDLVDQRGLADDVVVLLTADHGSQAADPQCRGDWDDALRAAGIPFRDEAYGFLYLGHS